MLTLICVVQMVWHRECKSPPPASLRSRAWSCWGMPSKSSSSGAIMSSKCPSSPSPISPTSVPTIRSDSRLWLWGLDLNSTTGCNQTQHTSLMRAFDTLNPSPRSTPTPAPAFAPVPTLELEPETKPEPESPASRLHHPFLSPSAPDRGSLERLHLTTKL